MADIRCPNCGKNNPSNLELCQFCYTRLKPTGELPPSSSEDLLNLLGEQEAEGEVPDWLRDLRPEDRASPFTEDIEGGEAAGDLSLDWLREESEAQEAEGTESAPAESAFTEGAFTEGAFEEDWLGRLEEDRTLIGEDQEATPFATDEETAEEAPSSSQAYDETLEWLSSLDQEGPETSAQAGAPGLFDAAVEETGLERLEQTEEPEPAEQPDWLAGLESEGEETASFTLQEGEADLEMSFQDLGKTPAAEDWFSSQEEEAAGRFTLEESAAEPGEQPDWLKRLGEQEPEPEVPKSAEFIEPEPSEAAAFASPFTEDIDEFLEGGQEPGWFGGAEESAGQPEQQETPEAEIPDWLRQAGEGATPFAAAEEQAGALPEWFEESAEQPEEEALSFGEPAGEASFASFDMEQEAVPDWLTKLDQSGSEPPEAGSIPAFILDETITPFGAEEPEQEEAPSAEFGAAPDWLEQITGSEEMPPVEAAELEAPAPDEGLAPAELPGWLEAMRPSEGAATGIPFRDTSDDRVETGGLLAGLPGILSAEYDIQQVRKPPAYSLKLQVPRDQQERVDLLKALLAEEERVTPTAKPLVLPTTYILRLIILGAFILGAIFAFWTSAQQTPLPGASTIPQPAIDLNQVVRDLPPGMPVLVAFDYEPGSVPELEAAALGVIDQLLAKGSILRTVSTNQTGPALAKHMLDRALAMPERLNQPPPDIAHLGYIPGGPSGLQAFGRDPAGLMRYDLQSTESGEMNAWQSPTFNPTDGLANFKLVLVISDNVESTRGWIEQVGARLLEKQIPLGMIVSAQIEPMVLPYYATVPRQVAGIASGVMGGVFIESLNGRAGPAVMLMDAYSLTLAVAVVLILIGSLVHLVSGQLKLLKNLRSEGQA